MDLMNTGASGVRYDFPVMGMNPSVSQNIQPKCADSISRNLHEQEADEVAEIVRAPVNTVKTRMFYARKRMQTLLEAAGLDAR